MRVAFDRSAVDLPAGLLAGQHARILIPSILPPSTFEPPLSSGSIMAAGGAPGRAQHGSKSIIALPFAAKDETVSRVVAVLMPGAAMTTGRAKGDDIITEPGIASLRGKRLCERAEARRLSPARPSASSWKRTSRRYWIRAGCGGGACHRTGQEERQND